MISTIGFPAHVLKEMVSYDISIIGPCERGDDYSERSEAKIITELYALAYSSVASQIHHPFPVADMHLVSFQPTASSPCFSSLWHHINYPHYMGK